MPDPSPILTLTLNPALDMATEVPEILPGQKLRCSCLLYTSDAADE